MDVSTLCWIFGRGLSVNCGLTWDVPPEWKDLARDEAIWRIQSELPNKMKEPTVNTRPIHDFLVFLERRTTPAWRHGFFTTNWDYLLQAEIDNLYPTEVPNHLKPSAHVWHLNGNVQPHNNPHRSQIVLPWDCAQQRRASTEGNYAFSKLSWESLIAAVGISFRYDTDKLFLGALGSVANDLPIGESRWLVLNPCQSDREEAVKAIKYPLAVPVTEISCSFEDWTRAGFPQLVRESVFYNDTIF